MCSRILLVPLWLFKYGPMIRAQQDTANLSDAPPHQVQMQRPNPGPDALPSLVNESLTRKQTKQLALKNNPRINAATLLALAHAEAGRR